MNIKWRQEKLERINAAKKVCKEEAVCGLVENKESKAMLLLFLHSPYKKKIEASPEENMQ